jgi:hypothetical protein
MHDWLLTDASIVSFVSFNGKFQAKIHPPGGVLASHKSYNSWHCCIQQHSCSCPRGTQDLSRSFDVSSRLDFFLFSGDRFNPGFFGHLVEQLALFKGKNKMIITLSSL